MGLYKHIPALIILLTCAIAQCGEKTKVAFLLEHLLVRGTEVATFDYADFNEKLLDNESFIILFHEGNPRRAAMDHSSEVEEVFVKRFGKDHFFECKTIDEVNGILHAQNIEIIYWQVNGLRDFRIDQLAKKKAIHAVFGFVPQGDAFAAISQWLSKTNPDYSNISVVPYIVRTPKDRVTTLHDQLHIPREAIVFGRHGGYQECSVPFAKEAIIESALRHPNWYFLLLNTERFCDLANVIYLDKTWDYDLKEQFINTCDFMLHARLGGETFGLACAEFSVRNKPVITYRFGGDKAHVDLLHDKGLFYGTKEELLAHLEQCAAHRDEMRLMDWDAFSKDYNPEVVMQKFNAIFIQPLKNR